MEDFKIHIICWVGFTGLIYMVENENLSKDINEIDPVKYVASITFLAGCTFAIQKFIQHCI